MRRLVAACLCAVLGFALVLVLLPLGAIERLELLTVDARYQSGIGRKAPGQDVIIAWIDQESMDYVEKEGGFSWPWPRDVYGPVVQYLRDAGARAVAFDLLFDQHGAAGGDTDFANALAAGPGDVLAMKFVDFRATGRDDAETAAFAARGRGGELAALLQRPREHGIVLPLPELVAGADELGFVNISPDADKTFRRYDLLRSWGPPDGAAAAYPSLAAATALAAGAVTPQQLEDRLRREPDARVLLNFRGPAFTFAKVKFVNILLSMQKLEAGEAPLYAADLFRDKLVLVGMHAEANEDAHQTPLAERFPGAELHATALDNLLQDDALRAPAWDVPLAGAAAALAASAVFALPGVVAPTLALLGLATLALAGALLAWTSLLAVPIAAPAVAGGSAAAAAFLYRLLVEGRQKRELRRAFQSYLAPEVLAEILRDPAALRLGGEQRDVTLLFTDLQGFTGLAEHCRPQELVAFLNDYFTRMCAPLLAERGVIDKFVGDAIMAFFGAPAPDPAHGLAAVRAAGVACPDVLAVRTQRRWGLPRRSMLVMRALPVARPADPGLDFAAAARLTRRLLDAGIEHRDLHFANFVMQTDGELAVLDLQSARRHGAALSEARWRIAAAARLWQGSGVEDAAAAAALLAGGLLHDQDEVAAARQRGVQQQQHFDRGRLLRCLHESTQFTRRFGLLGIEYRRRGDLVSGNWWRGGCELYEAWLGQRALEVFEGRNPVFPALFRNWWWFGGGCSLYVPGPCEHRKAAELAEARSGLLRHGWLLQPGGTKAHGDGRTTGSESS
ncbi:MAG: CHASE2 domain-containing protein [Planctomycetes bacterium]|nr:CHASE2 domain-containing protein [Planctomycetota bacterium]